MTFRVDRFSIVAASLALTGLSMAPQVAEACGGTFCDAGPQTMPVDQTGENIVFVYNATTIEAHIQIQYTGEAEDFAWVIPVTSLPDIRVGSQALFDNLLLGTVPTFGTQTVAEPCPDQREIVAGGCGGFAGDDAAFFDEGFFGDGDGDGDGGSPNIAARGVAGAFEYSVLQGGTVQGVVDWLDANGYAQDDDAPPILGDYLDDGYLFVAVKLRSGAGVDEIQPLVLEYEGNEPCIPIKLTAIAAVDDMGIRAFFFGTQRSFPTNFSHVLINWAKLDWLSLGANYADLVTAAIDTDPSGHGFVTEYAGSTDVVSTEGVLGSKWSAPRFLELPAESVVNELASQDLMQCSTSSCEFFHPLVEPLLGEFLPVPTGVSPDAFYSCLSCYSSQIDPLAWDGVAFADAFAERIINPAVDAVSILQDKPYLTRLYTTISPHEMTVDPMFHQNDSLGDVSNQQIATVHLECEGSNWLELPDALIINYDENGAVPTFDDMPDASALETVPAEGAPVTDEDNAGTIADQLDEWNDANPSGPILGCACNSERNAPGFLGSLFIFGIAANGRRGRRRRRSDQPRQNRQNQESNTHA